MALLHNKQAADATQHCPYRQRGHTFGVFGLAAAFAFELAAVAAQRTCQVSHCMQQYYVRYGI